MVSGTEADDAEQSRTDAVPPGGTVGRRGVVGAVLGAVAAGAVVGVGATRLLDDDDSRGRSGPTSEPDEAGPVPDPEPAAADTPPIELTEATPAQVAEQRPTDPPPFDPNAPLNRLHDLRVAHEIIDDFPDAAIGERVGSAGWVPVSGGEGAGIGLPRAFEGGVVRLGTGTSATGRSGLHLGLDQMAGLPVFTMEWRLAWQVVDDGAHEAGTVFGCVNAVDHGGTAPTVGVYFLHRPDLSPNWLCVGAGAEGRSVVETTVAVGPGFHRFQVTSDGTNLCRFYIDDERVGSVGPKVPLTDDRYGVGIEVFKSAGSKTQSVDLDWFYLRREVAR